MRYALCECIICPFNFREFIFSILVPLCQARLVKLYFDQKKKYQDKLYKGGEPGHYVHVLLIYIIYNR
jgi:hypothetical protein